jgi:hypothetical protein
MWQNFYAAGGWGMYPTSLFGFLSIGASALYALRLERRFARLAGALAGLTLAAGLLGATVGICNSAHYITEVPKTEQLQILALGFEESLHDLVLALILAILGGLVAVLGLLRAGSAAGVSQPAASGAHG